MANVFISYSRKDEQFVRELHAALVQRDLESWVDWEDIPLTADFLEVIYAAIEAADTFVFVISPDSARSEICALEIAHAVKHNKRLIPVVRRPGAEKEVPPAVARLNWIFFRPEDDFEKAFDALITAIATDLDWAHRHTRLLIHALEWEDRGRSANLLLRGEPLREAEEWLAAATGEKNPQPTPVQRAYVLASRRAQTGRLRTLVGGAAAAVVLSLALAVLALVQRGDALEQRGEAEAQRAVAVIARGVAEERRSDAETQRGEAETQRAAAVAQGATAVAQGNARATAEARALSERDAAERARVEAEQARAGRQSFELTANALAQLPTDPELSVRLAAEAMRLSPSRDAEEALRRSLVLSLTRLTLRGHTGQINGIAYSPNGNLLVTGGADGTARVWDAPTGRATHVLRVGGNGVRGVVFSPDSTRVALVSGGAAQVWNAITGERVAELRGHTGAVASVAYSPDGRFLVTGGADNAARVWDAATGAVVATLAGHTGTVWSAEFSPDGGRVATASGDGTARVWEATTGRGVAELRGHGREFYGSVISRVNSARFSPDGSRVVTSSHDGSARVWEADTGNPLLELRNSANLSFMIDAAFSPGGNRIVTAGGDGTARLWEAATGARLAELRGHSSLVNAARFSPDGLRVLTASADRTARVWDTVTGENIGVLAGHGEGVLEAAFSPDGDRVATASIDGTARIWEASAGQAATEMREDVVQGVALSTDGARLLTVDGLGRLLVWDAATGKPTGRHQLYGTLGEHLWFTITFSPDRRRVAMADYLTNKVVIWEPDTDRTVATLTAHTDRVNSIVFSRDGSRLLTASEDMHARVWEVETGRLVAQVPHANAVNAADFRPDGTRFATVASDGFLRVWDAATGARVAEFFDGNGSQTVAYSPDGTRIVTGGSDNFARVWDASSGAPLLTLRGHTSFLRSSVFSPDGRYVLTAAADSTARVWDATSGTPLLTLRGHGNADEKDGGVSVWAAFDATGRRIVTYATDYRIRIAACEACGTADDLHAAVRARGVRDLTTEERMRYLPERKP